MAANTTIPMLAEPSDPIQVPSLADTYGALFIGNCVALVYVFQRHIVASELKNPMHYLVRLYGVVVIFLCETLHAILPIHLCYYHLVKNYFNPVALGNDTWSLRLLAPLSSVSMLACQGFYTRRVFIFDSRYRIIVAATIVLLLAETGFMIALSVKAYEGRQMQDFLHLTWIVSAVYGLAMAIDSILTGTLIIYLLGSRTGTKRTDTMVQTLIVYTVNTGLVTSIVAMLSFVFGIIMPGNLVYFAMGIVATKRSCCSLSMKLNSRRSLSSAFVDNLDSRSIMFNNSMGCTHCSAVQRKTAPQVALVSFPGHGDVDTSGNGSESQVEEMRFRGGDPESAAGSEAKKVTVGSV
ncbi:hypothetical protein BD310DRAFT_970774 [Dichomitus squalens]|uniref:DUF6534 domain-containing protein n=1 Tax=Dichomitus squalens TaxID=114155 RepID=A0A4Q9PCJ5_9APHY|nr:hypothetical protein BD310DRAFT_970774 [Dichomitus squalens]